MNRKSLTGALVFSLSAGVSVFAADMKAIDNEMKMMDTNGDGRISPDEHAAGTTRMFATMDADKDGKVTAAEMTASHEKVTGTKPATGEMSAADKIKTIDRDSDRALTADEHQAASKSMFARMDTDQDGFLSKAELTAGHAMKMKK